MAEKHSLAGRVAIVTGAGRGIGRAIAEGLAGAGAALLINDRAPENLADVEAHLTSHGVAFTSVAGDIGEEEVARALPALAVDRLGRLDIVVNNAAIFRPAPFLNLDLEAVDDVFRVNFRAVVVLCQAAARHWAEAGKPGVIVNISSVSASFAQPGQAHYGASKAAIERFSRNIALELSPRGIRVNCVAPGGPIFSEYVQQVMSDPVNKAYAKLRPPLGRLGDPAEVADAVVYLTSDAASYITGSVLTVDGGLTLGRRF